MVSSETAVVAQVRSGTRVLCVDLDGTVIRGDLVWECLVSLIKKNPLSALKVPFWLLAGRAHLKTQLARSTQLDVASLPYRQDVLDFLKERRAAGFQIVMVTAAAQEMATRVADHLGVFDACYGSSDGENLKGRSKAEFLRQKFGDSGFEYLGDSPADLPVWRSSSSSHVVGNQNLVRRAASKALLGRVFPEEQARLGAWVAALRGHHWFKNLLLFLPLALAHRFEARSWIMTAAGFLLFGLCASGIYVLNDLLDLHSDRVHPWKRNRPFAAGEIPIPAGLLICCVLLMAALPAGFLLGRNFGMVLIGYTALTLWYSAYLKKIVLLDAFVLSSFYSIRIWAGALISAVPLSHWFLSFSLFFFLSLSMAKRYSELLHAGDLVEQGRSGRGYVPADRVLLMNLGIASGFSAIVIFILYLHSPEVLTLYQRPGLLLLLAPALAYWLSRLWLEANRGALRDDPVVLALKDPVSYFAAAFALLVLIASSARPH